ncbi:DNA modification methylase (plasmid) [Methanothermobacter sp. CaT2]|uniref:Type II methyltransferase M.MthZI n=1 Tax=Methanothermobacter thermautotrophicus TaxID=145262 RepID=MTHZ_METTF|nr:MULTISPECIES: site-specific DNA-methyltransferase [Methanothermobacter]P29568.1 RecName: Full=Type II methyltransferase M.MthZI; Short=M.MthZI; AltName: Full=Modification methylase MthZI; AltName: Full=N-4 cytosine-specific methyltransferase MthZI [Methanothermobacter thermautotrophicus]WBF07315.1 site-specific DNA-methyltransferase [Methanothermobacter thermautotrophicus]CAA47651.1 mthZIM [Methanothermobacter thermautotrophicus]CAA48447.1 ZIM [Methanothermobacter thermautotrophicus]BAM7100
MKTTHRIYFKNSADMNELKDKSINLVVTSPPYPMVEIWDRLFSELNPKIEETLIDEEDGLRSYNLMHEELEKVWHEVDRVTAPGGVVIINIGDATRKIGKKFQLYPNHVRTIDFFFDRGYQVLPFIIWRKQSNKPTKFMGSGMLPPNAYVTHEHEYILIFRKEGPRQFKTEEERKLRRESAYFWEERNQWFSDVWTDLTGVSQRLNHKNLRKRAAAYPFELAYRLINMYSIMGDWVLDPFLGTGTTMIAAACAGRNSIGYELDHNFKDLIESRINETLKLSNEIVMRRINDHIEFIREKNGKYYSENYKFKVTTRQEQDIRLYYPRTYKKIKNNEFEFFYQEVNPKKERQSKLNI